MLGGWEVRLYVTIASWLSCWLPSKLRVASHTRLRARDHYTSGTNGVYKWMQDRCEVYMDFPHGIEWIMFHGHLDYFQKPSLGCKPNTKPGDHGTPNAHNCWFILFDHVWGPVWREIAWNGIWLRVRDHTTWFWRCVGTAFGHFLVGSHNFVVTARGSRVWRGPKFQNLARLKKRHVCLRSIPCALLKGEPRAVGVGGTGDTVNSKPL